MWHHPTALLKPVGAKGCSTSQIPGRGQWTQSVSILSLPCLKPVSLGSCSTPLLPDWDQQAQMVMAFSHTLAKALKLAGAQTRHSSRCTTEAGGHVVKVYPFYLAKASELALLPMLSIYSIKADRHMQSTQETPLDHLALVDKGVCVQELHRTAVIRKTVLGSVQGTAETADKNNPPVFLKH